MDELHDEILDQYLYTEKIKNTLNTIRYFLISIFIVCLCIYAIYHISYGYSFVLNIWFNCTEILILICLGITHLKFQSSNYSYKNANLWIIFICLLTGSTIAVGASILYFYLPQHIEYLPFYQALGLSALLIILSLIFALTFLTQKMNYFLLYFLPLIIPFLYTQLILLIDKQQLFFIIIDFLIVAILICAKISIQINKKLSLINHKNKALVQDAKYQILIRDKLNQQLKIEMQKNKIVKNQLKTHMQTLEDKIKERTMNLEVAHQDLKNKQTNLILAHDIAGLTPWDWNIKERIFTLTDKSNQTYTHDTSLIHQKNYIHPSDLKSFKSTLREHLRGLSDQFEATYRVKCSDGKWHWIHDIGRVILRNPKNNFALQMIGIRRDIHKERIDQERLILSASVLQQATEGIFILDEDFRYIDANPFYETLTGFSREKMLGKHIFDITANYKANQRSMHNSIINEILTTGKFNSEITEKFLSGSKLTIRIHINAIKDDLNKTMNYIGIVSDLTEKRLQEQRLSYLENYDTLTDLPNRFYYNYQLHQYLVTHHDSIKQLAIIRLNIDRFRNLNEYLTPSGGDELLKQLAQRLRLSNAEALFLAHLNADNFAIIYELSHIRPSIEKLCKRISNVLSLPFNINNEDHIITVSIGVSLYPEHGRQIDYLNSYAEQALTEAKRLGGNTIRYYNVNTHALVDENVHLERELRQAIKNKELIVYYQPKLYFNDFNIQGFEALVRWQHPSKGIIPPNMFLPIAEKTSLISEIGDFVITEVAEQIKKWQLLGYHSITVSLNIVAQQLHRGHLLETIDQVLNQYQISGKSIELEITESSLLDKSDLVKKTLTEIKNRDILISLDDFGTGYSSLSYLTDFPIDILKIDRSFVSKIGNPKQEAVVSAIIAMGKAMGMTIVAEGVETHEQKKYLHHLKCDIAQGFLFSRPLPEGAATNFLKQKVAH